MNGALSFARRHGRRIVAILVVVPLYALARLPTLSDSDLDRIAARFAFERHEIASASTRALRTTRPVHPDLERIRGWINVLGAGVALCDLDADGLPDDLILSDPRTDEVSVQPAPTTGARYKPFVLEPVGVPYDRACTAPMGAVPCDMNEDGLLDVLVYYWGRTPLAFLRRAGTDGSLDAHAFVAREIVPSGERWYSNAATFADLDGDGHADLILGNYFADGERILDATATDHPHMQASMSRSTNGGRDRLFLWKHGQGGTEPDVAFEDKSAVLSDEILCGWTLAVGAVDLDGDQLPEIYFANDFGRDRLLHNRSHEGALEFALLEGRRSLTMPRSKVLGQDSFKGMGVDFGDVNGDGVLDLYVSNITTEFGLEESQFLFVSNGPVSAMRDGVAPYVDESEELGLSRSGWAWDSKLADFDNDGYLEALQALGFLAGRTNRWPELHEIAMCGDPLLSGPRRWHRFSDEDDLSGHDASPFFALGVEGRYHDIASRLGIDQHEVRRGISPADIDGDGDLDFAVANQWCASALYLNTSPNVGASLDLSLLLPINQKAGDVTTVHPGPPDPKVAARAAIGATVLVDFPKGSSGPLGVEVGARIAFVDGGNGHTGVRSHDVHLGLGQMDPLYPLVPVVIAWRDTFGQAQRHRFELRPGRTTLYLGAEEASR